MVSLIVGVIILSEEVFLTPPLKVRICTGRGSDQCAPVSRMFCTPWSYINRILGRMCIAGWRVCISFIVVKYDVTNWWRHHVFSWIRMHMNVQHTPVGTGTESKLSGPWSLCETSGTVCLGEVCWNNQLPSQLWGNIRQSDCLSQFDPLKRSSGYWELEFAC